MNKYGYSMTEAEYEAGRQKDRDAGFRDRMAGFYDKWYRYNHSDNGKAYDEGVALALKTNNHSEDFYLIEVIESCIS